MGDKTIKGIVTVIGAIILLAIAVKLIKWAIYTLLTIAVLVGAAYIVYRIIKGRRT